MYFGLEGTLHQLQHPINQPTINISSNQILLNRTFLQNSQTEPLSNIAILLLFQNFNNSLNNNVTSIIGNILDTFDGGYDN